MCKVISVANQKGGVAKSTTTLNLGVGLARQGKKVLLIDADPQGIVDVRENTPFILIMKEYIDTMRSRYDYILIDCMPSLGMMTINALVASDTVLIPVQAAYLPVKGLQQLIRTISMVKKRLNRKLTIHGILLTMVDFRTNYAKDIASRVRETYGSKIAIFENVIPLSVKVAEASAEGKSIYRHCSNGKVSIAYEKLTQEVLENEK